MMETRQANRPLEQKVCKEVEGGDPRQAQISDLIKG